VEAAAAEGGSIVPGGGNKWLGALGFAIVDMEENSALLFCHHALLHEFVCPVLIAPILGDALPCNTVDLPIYTGNLKMTCRSVGACNGLYLPLSSSSFLLDVQV